MQEGLAKAGGQPRLPKNTAVEREQDSWAHTGLPKGVWGIPKLRQVGVGWPSEKRWPEGNSLDEGGAMENGNIPQF